MKSVGQRGAAAARPTKNILPPQGRISLSEKLGREIDPRYHPASAPYALHSWETTPLTDGNGIPPCPTTVPQAGKDFTEPTPRRNATVTSPYRFQPPRRGRYLSVWLAFDGANLIAAFFMNAECRMQNAECRMQNAECRMQNAECRMQNLKWGTRSGSCEVGRCPEASVLSLQ